MREDVTYIESMQFAEQFCAHRPTVGAVESRSRFSRVSITEAKFDRLKEYLQERQAMIDRFNLLITKQLKSDEHLSLDSFRILRRLGKGGFASVFLAYHPDNNEYLALKAMKKSSLVETHDQNLIISERQYTFALHHPNIVNLHRDE